MRKRPFYMARGQLKLARFQLSFYGLRLPPVGGMVEIPAYGRRQAKWIGHDKRGFFVVGASREPPEER